MAGRMLIPLGVLVCLCGGAFGPPPARAGENGDEVKLFPIVKDGKWGYMDEKGKVVIEPQYDAAFDFSEGLACVVQHPWRGYIDRTGNMVIKPSFLWAGPFREGYASVSTEKRVYGGEVQFYPGGGAGQLIDRTGTVLKRDGHFGSTAGVIEGVVIGDGKSIWGADGKKFQHDAEQVCQFSEGLAPAMKRGRWGYLDHDMKWVIEPQFHDVDRFSDGLAAVGKSEPPPPESGSRWEWLKKAKFTWGFIDKTGKQVVDYRFEDACYFKEGLASVRINGKWGYVDRAGKTVVEPKYDYAWPFSEGMGRVMVGGKQGFIDKSGKLVVQPQYQPAWDFSKGLARVALGDGKEECKEGYIDKTGKYVWEPTEFRKPAENKGAAEGKEPEKK